MLKRRSGGQELGELISTARNTYANPGSVAQFDFHKSDQSNVSLPQCVHINSCCHDTRGICEVGTVWDYNFTTHVHVLSRIVSPLVRISVSLVSMWD
jgi:hypothetical protein